MAGEKPFLAPCPFCGGQATEWTFRVDGGGDSATVFNVGCRAHMNLAAYSSQCGPWGYRRPDDPPDNETALASARDAWNVRPTISVSARKHDKRSVVDLRLHIAPAFLEDREASGPYLLGLIREAMQ